MQRFKEREYLYNITRVIKYNDNCYKLITYKILKNSAIEGPKKIIENDSYDFKLDNSISRAKKNIRELALCNDWEYFITLTQDSSKVNSRYDLQEYIKNLGIWLRSKYRNYDIKYLLVPEKHKDGAWHIHGLITGIPDKDLTINSNNYLDWSPYSKRFGFCSLDRIKDRNKIANYILKYISKDLAIGIEKNKKLYYSSRGLKRSTIIKQDYISKNFSPDFENDFCMIKEFDNLKDIMLLFD